MFRAPLWTPVAWTLATAILLSVTAPLEAREVRVGVLIDGPSAREGISADSLEHAAAAVYGDGLTLTAAPRTRLDGNWSAPALNAALDRLEADPQVDVVVTLGFAASHLVAHRAQLPKPTIAASVLDPVLQNFPLKGGTSGRHNFTYVTTLNRVDDQVGTFHRIVGFSHLAVLADPLALEVVRELQVKAEQLQAATGATIVVRPTHDLTAALADLPPGTDAVYVTPLMRLSGADLRSLANQLAQRKLPTFSLLGRSEVEQGLLLASSSDTERTERLARRIALDIQRIVEGDDAANIEVAVASEARLVVNMHTAQLIGFSPNWDDLTDAVQLAAEEMHGQRPISLLQALNAAIGKNPSLHGAQLGADIAADQTRIARSALLPSLTANTSHTQIDASHANPLLLAQRTSEGGATAQLTLYSDSAWAGWSVSRRLAAAADEQAHQELLDTIQQTATAYFGLLRAKAVTSVRRQNVENTRQNLETARAREAVGLSTRSDYLRWVAQMASARQDLLIAEANERQATVELGRLIHDDSAQPLVTVEAGVDEPLNWIASPHTQRYLDTPARWQVFQEFILSQAHQYSPEVKRIDELLAGQQREVTSARRAFFIPDLVAIAAASDQFSRGGAGSQRTPSTPGDTAWFVGIQAKLPIFSGGALKAKLSESRHQLRQLDTQRDATVDAVDARARSVLARITSSYPAIALSHEAAAAAHENYAQAADAYARGVISITDLISAQDASLNAGLSQAQATFTFLIDFADTLRVSNSFAVLLDPQTREPWYDSVDAWFRTRGISIPTH
ncbi:MAG: periplasmic substrate-binding protein and efflux pump, family, outer membrane protein [Gammaproteobacteria bacterium]|nr:periplasmic substrate-binding protein and efflux pump, family, outer membrane protein [Gammaproteobacteria bacterium]